MQREQSYWSALNYVFSTELINPRGIWPVGNVMSYENLETLRY